MSVWLTFGDQVGQKCPFVLEQPLQVNFRPPARFQILATLESKGQDELSLSRGTFAQRKHFPYPVGHLPGIELQNAQTVVHFAKEDSNSSTRPVWSQNPSMVALDRDAVCVRAHVQEAANLHIITSLSYTVGFSKSPLGNHAHALSRSNNWHLEQTMIRFLRESKNKV